MSEINAAARMVYADGTDPIDWAIHLAEIQIFVIDSVREGRAKDPKAYPGFFTDVTPTAAATRIIGELLDAGWTPPQLDERTGR